MSQESALGSSYRSGTSPQTRTLISSRNRILAVHAGDTSTSVIGTISQFNPSDSRNVDPVRGIGFGDQIQELVPGMSEPITLSVTRTAMYVSNIFQVFGYKGGVDGLVRALKHHRWPFDITQQILMSDAAPGAGFGSSTAQASPINSNDSMLDPGATATAIVTLYAGCWMTRHSSTVSADTAIVTEDCDISVTDIFASTTPQASYTADNLNNPSKSVLYPNS